MDEISEEKNRLRSEIFSARAKIPMDRIVRDSGIIMDELKKLEAYRSSSTIMCYVNFNKEVITQDFIRYSLDMGKKIFVPVIIKKADGSRTMKASRLIDPDNELEKGTMGILEPKPEYRRFIEPSEIDFIVVPGLAFDIMKNRLGYSGGFYDEMLKNIRSDCKTVAVCFDFQVLDKIPVNNYDVPVNMLITEKRII